MEAQDLLKQHRLSKTEIRMDLLNLFLGSSSALSLTKLSEELDRFDRATIYRSLKKFESKGIIHSIHADAQSPHYALCGSSCSEGEHQHDHAHLHCLECACVRCENVDLSAYRNIPGFQVKEAELSLRGLCDDCRPS